MVIRNILRYKNKSAVTVVITMSLAIILNVYIEIIAGNSRQLNRLPEAVPVYCQITNLNGSRASGLVIEGSLIDKIQASGDIRNGAFTVRMMAGIGEFLPEEWKANLNLFVAGISCAQAIPGLKPDSVSLSEEEQERFWNSSEEKCIVSSTLMKERGWKTGDTLPLNLYYYDYDDIEGINCYPLRIGNVEIIGEMNPVLSQTEQCPPDILLPLKTVQSYYRQQGISFSVDSAAFYLADPFRLNEFKENMKKLGFSEKTPSARDSYKGNALTVKDSTFISLAENLEEIIAFMEAFFPPICVLLAVIGYIVSFLLMNSRKKEIALLRAMGMAAGRCVGMMWREQMLLAVCGLLAGGAISLVFGEKFIIWTICGIVFAAYLSGVWIALCRLSQRSSIQALLAEE